MLIVQPVRRKFSRHFCFNRSPASAGIDVEVHSTCHTTQCKCVIAFSCEHIIGHFRCRSHIDFNRKGVFALQHRIKNVIERYCQVSAHHDSVLFVCKGCCRRIRDQHSVLALIRDKGIISLKSLDLFNIRCNLLFSILVCIDKLFLSICQSFVRSLEIFRCAQLAVIIYNELIHSLDHFICSFLVISVLIKGIYSMVCHRRIDHSICICVICDRHHRIFPLINFIVRELILRQRSLSAGRTTGSE